jgi:hypothetical protein
MSHLHRAVIRVNYRSNQGCIIHRCQGQKSVSRGGINTGVANTAFGRYNKEEIILTAHKEMKRFIL